MNIIRGLSVEGAWMYDPLVVKNKVKEFFESIFKVNPRAGLLLEGVHFSSISPVENVAITTSFGLEEI